MESMDGKHKNLKAVPNPACRQLGHGWGAPSAPPPTFRIPPDPGNYNFKAFIKQ